MKIPSIILAAALLVVGIAATASAQSNAPRPELPVTDSGVFTAIRSGGTLYIGGSFSVVGPHTGCAVPIDASSGLPVAGFPQVSGALLTVVPDGSGGWYIGGGFAAVGGLPRNNLAHIDAANQVTAWDPAPDGTVTSLAVNGSTVYVGGTFTTIGVAARRGVAALDATTGLATAWDPNPNPGAFVSVVAVDGSTVYAGGNFSTIGGAARSNIVALDATTGLATAWDPNPDNSVSTLAVSGSTIYVVGGFSTIGGAPRIGLAAVDASTGLATAWDAHTTGSILALAVSVNTVYVGGNFGTIGGAARSRIAALDATTGLPTAWDPGADGIVFALAVSGSTVYAGGDFKVIGGAKRFRIAALDGTTGLATAWTSHANDLVRVLATSGSVVFAGGSFNSIGGVARSRIAALDATTGAVSGWDPSANGLVQALAVSGSTVYVGGSFTSIGGAVRNNVAALDATTGLATPWNPNADSQINALAMSGSTIYAAGGFGAIGGASRHYIAAIDAVTGFATTWDPGANAPPFALAVNGSTIYAAGNFTAIGGAVRNRIAALDATTGLATAWNPNANSYVSAMTVSGSSVYVGGNFTSIGGASRNYIAALDGATGLATSWNPNASASVLALASDGGTIYAGGNFIGIGGSFHRFLASLDVTTGLAKAWSPFPNIEVRALAVDGSNVYAGGFFSIVGDENWTGFAGFSTCTPPAITGSPESATICAGIPVTFSVSATGTGPLSYQWRRDLVDIPGATGSSYTISAVSAGDAGAYDVRVSNACGSQNSASAALTVNTAPAIASSPGSASQCPGRLVSFSVSATGTEPLAYQWRKNSVNIPGARGSSYTISAVSATDAGSYDVLVTNSCGSKNSAAATLTVGEPPVITYCPPDVTVELGDTTPTGIATATGTGVTVTATDVFVPGCGGQTGVLTRTWMATGTCGTANCTQKITRVDTTAPVVTITGPAGGAVFPIGNTVTFTGSFADDYGAPHAATWTLDTITQPGTVTEGAVGTVTASYTFTAAGVYKVKLTVTDACGNAGTAEQIGGVDALVVVYDPSAGFVTGNAIIDSPAGAYPADPLLTGKANCGFVCKYKKGAAAPTGETQFQLRTAGLTFNSTAYEWLVVSGGRAQFKGSGTVNGAAGYGFILTAEDGAITGGADKFRIKITGPSGVAYDNQIGDPDNAALTTELRGGAIIVNTGGKGNAPAAAGPAVESGREDALSAAVPLEYALAQNFPNPFDRSSVIAFSLPERSRLSIIVYDVAGRAVRTLADGEWAPGRHSATLSREAGDGGRLCAGVYFVRMSAQSLASGKSFRSMQKLVVVN